MANEEEQLRSGMPQNAQGVPGARLRTEEELRKQTEMLRVTLASIGDGVICTDEAGRVTFLNHVSELLTGWTNAEAQARPLEEVFRIVHETTRETVENPAARAMREETVVALGNQAVLLSRDGNEYPIEDTAAPIRDETGVVAGCVLVFRDVAERRKGEIALRDSRAYAEWQRRVYEAILTNTPDFAYVFDLQHRVIYANDVLLRMWGRTWEEAIGKGFIDIGYEPWHAAMHNREIDQVAHTKAPIRGEVPFSGTFGRRIYDYIFVPVFGADGEVEAVAGTTRDVTDRQLAETRIRTSEERVRLAADAAELGIWVWDVATDEVVWENDRAYEIFGLPLKSAAVNAARFKSEFVHPDDAAGFNRSVEEAVLKKNRFQFLGRIRRTDGVIRWVEFIGRPVPAEDGSRLQLHGTAQDVTERTLVTERVRFAAESNAKMRSLFEQGTQFAGMLSLDGIVVEANRMCVDACGYTREDVLGKFFWECGWWNRSAEVMQVVREASLRAADGYAFRGESKYFAADGSERYLDLSIAPVRDENGKILFVSPTGTDITDRKRVEKALRESEQRFRLMADAAPVLIWVAEIDKGCSWFNQTWLEFVGRPMEKEIGIGWREHIHPEDAARCAATYASAFDKRERFSMDYRLRRADGEYRWILDTGVPRYGSRGEFGGYIGSCVDITERRAVEEELALHKSQLETRIEDRTKELMETHHRLRMSERLASMGAMSAGLGHDMGNLLMPVRVRLDSLEESALSAQAKEDIKAIRTSAEYLQRLANGLRLLALDPEQSRVGEVTELCSWWSDAHGVMQSVLPRGVTLEAEFPEGQCRTRISKAALTQVVFNLVQNAGDAMGEAKKGKVKVRGWCEGNEVLVSVQDEGPGMTETVKARCMEPFFTTKTRGISTGLGLVLVYGLVREAAGRVELESELGKGTTFTLRLPLEKEVRVEHGTKVAVLQLKDARLHSFVAGELRSLGFEVRKHEEPGIKPTIVVVDDVEWTKSVPSGTRVLLMGKEMGSSGGPVISLGEKPPIASIREALRTMAVGGEAVKRKENGQGTR